jgi:hypothetical protein
MNPEILLDNFEVKPETQGEFCAEKYLAQLERPGFELYPSLKSKLNLAKILR